MRPRRAVLARLGLVEAVATLARRVQRDWGVTLAVQVGRPTGLGQGVGLRGEAGIGKSRLVQMVPAPRAGRGPLRLECHCAPSFQHPAFSPLVPAPAAGLARAP